MRVSADIFCNCCGAEIPEGEENHEFASPLLVEAGHCHSECLAQRNHVIEAYESSTRSLSSMLDPRHSNITKVHQSIAVEAQRQRPLKRYAPERAPEPRPPRAKKKVKR